MLQEKTSSAKDHLIIEATQANYSQLANFLNQNIKTHRHLDWFSSLDWIGSHPYLIEFQQQKINAVLCATPENGASAWVRIFSVQKKARADETWARLLPRALQKLRDKGITRLAALALHGWFEALLIDSGFENRQNVVVLEWQGNFPSKGARNPGVVIRPMHLNDLPEVERIDRLAFPSLWQNSQTSLTKAFNQTGISTVATRDEVIVGYQISTSMTISGHLARLAVDPAYQCQGIAFTLVHDLLKQFEQRGFWRVTVNTQSDNQPSLSLYQKFGFKPTKEEIKVYDLAL